MGRADSLYGPRALRDHAYRGAEWRAFAAGGSEVYCCAVPAEKVRGRRCDGSGVAAGARRWAICVAQSWGRLAVEMLAAGKIWRVGAAHPRVAGAALCFKLRSRRRLFGGGDYGGEWQGGTDRVQRRYGEINGAGAGRGVHCRRRHWTAAFGNCAGHAVGEHLWANGSAAQWAVSEIFVA